MNLDKRQTLGHWGKLPEFFFGNRPALIGGMLESAWAGDRIICVGDYIEDWPDGLLSQREVEEMEAKDTTSLYDMIRLVPYDEVDAAHIPRMTVYEHETPIVLRNLTKRQFVREDVLFHELASGPLADDEQIQLGHVVVSLICWSGDHYMAEGLWAGNRLDVVSVKTLEEELDAGDPWQDATRSCAKLLKSIASNHNR